MNIGQPIKSSLGRSLSLQIWEPSKKSFSSNVSIHIYHSLGISIQQPIFQGIEISSYYSIDTLVRKLIKKYLFN